MTLVSALEWNEYGTFLKIFIGLVNESLLHVIQGVQENSIPGKKIFFETNVNSIYHIANLYTFSLHFFF